MLILDMGAWILGVLNGLGVLIIRGCAFVVDALFKLTMQIALTNLFSDDLIEGIASNLYFIIALYIYIKVALLLIRYIANPEHYEFKAGSSRDNMLSVLFGKVIIAVILTVTAPSIFKVLRGIQPALVDFAFQVVNTEKSGYTSAATADLYQSCTYRLSSGVNKNVNGVAEYKDGTLVSCPEYPDGDTTAKLIRSTTYFEADVGNTLSSAMVKPFLSINPIVILSNSQRNYYERVIDENDNPEYYQRLQEEIYEKEKATNGDKEVIIKFQWPLALIALIVAAIMVIQSILKIAMRSIKLSILEIMSPLAIMTFVDPFQKLDEKSVTGRYIKAYMKTYMELFIWVLTLAIVMLALSSLDELAIFKNSFLGGILIIIALLKGLNDIPPMITEIMTGTASGDAGFAGKMGAKAANAIIGGTTGTIAGGAKGMLRGGPKGALGGAMAGGAAAMKEGFQNEKSIEEENSSKDKAAGMSGFAAGAAVVPGKGNVARFAEKIKPNVQGQGEAMVRDALFKKAHKTADKAHDKPTNANKFFAETANQAYNDQLGFEDKKDKVSQAAVDPDLVEYATSKQSSETQPTPTPAPQPKDPVITEPEPSAENNTSYDREDFERLYGKGEEK